MEIGCTIAEATTEFLMKFLEGELSVALSSSSLQPTYPYHPSLVSAALCSSSIPLEASGATVSGHHIGRNTSLLPNEVMCGKLEASLSEILKSSL